MPSKTPKSRKVRSTTKPAELPENLTESAMPASIRATSTVKPTSDTAGANANSSNLSSALAPNLLDTKSFRLLDLPVEVRQMIYKVLLISAGEISFTRPTIPGHVTHHLKCYTCSLNLPRNLPLNRQIMYTCKAIYEEALPILYELNTFSIRAHDRGYRNCSLAWTDMQLRGPGLLHLRRLKLEAPMLRGILKGSVYSFWHQLLRKCPALEHVALVSVGNPRWNQAGETAITLAWNIAHCFPKNAPASATNSLSLVVKLRLEAAHQSNMTQVASRSTHAPMSMAEGLQIEVQGTLDPWELEIMEAYQTKGWAWRKISEDVGKDCPHVVLQWRKA